MFKIDELTVLSEVKLSQKSNRITIPILMLVMDLMSRSSKSFITNEVRGFIVQNIQKHILKMTEVELGRIEQGIKNPPIYVGEPVSLIVIINSFITLCAAEWYTINRR